MRRFLIRVMFALLPMALMAAVNYTRDPAGLFTAGVEGRIGAILAEGHAVTIPPAYNVRLIVRSYVQHAPQPPDVVVLGSSRAMRIRSSAFPGRTLINQAVFSATGEDFVSIMGMYERTGRWPREALLVLDPWLLNDFNGLTGWRSLAPEYEYMSRRIGVDPSGLLPTMWPELDRYVALFSPAYFQAAIRARASAEQARRVVQVPDAPAEEAILLHDGSRLDGRDLRKRTRGDVERRALHDSSPPIDGLEHFAALSPSHQRELTLLTRFLLRRGIRVTYALMPYHPIMRRVLFTRDTYRMIGQAERRYRALAREFGIPIRGSYDPVVCGCVELDFLDGMHPDAPCSERALAVNAGY